jgi:large subunit ribosomal protein L4
MATVNVINNKGEKVSQVDLADDLFSVEIKPCVMHEVVTMQLASRRAGSASVKHRSEIRGSQRKLFRQKGTGRARRGNIKSPLLRGGGVVFGPDPKSYGYNVPKKVKKLALKMALSAKLKENELVVIDRFGLERIKTKDLVSVLAALDVNSALIVTDEPDDMLERSSRNVSGVKVLKVEGLNVYDMLKHTYLILVESSIKGIEGRLLS